LAKGWKKSAERGRTVPLFCGAVVSYQRQVPPLWWGPLLPRKNEERLRPALLRATNTVWGDVKRANVGALAKRVGFGSLSLQYPHRTSDAK
jgi:hypothetical protein